MGASESIVVQPSFTQVDENRYNDRLEILPPIAWCSKGFLVGEPYTHRTCRVTGKVRPTYTAMVVRSDATGKRYYESKSDSDSTLTISEWRALDVRTLQIEGVS